MSSLSQRRPRLAPALVLLWMLSLSMLVLMFKFDQYPRLIIHHRLIPFGCFIYSSYYLVRLFQSRSQNDSWPIDPTFPGKKEKECYRWFSSTLSFNYLVAWPIFISGPSTLKLRWPDDDMEIISRAIYLLSLIASMVVAIQAHRTRRQEDRAKCAIKHKWACSYCGVMGIDPARNDMPVHSSSLHPEQVLKFILGFSVVINSMIILSAFNCFGHNEPRRFYLLAAVPSCNILHHVVRIVQIMASSARRRNLAAWPKAPIFEKRNGAAYHCLYMWCMLISYLAQCEVMADDMGLAVWRSGHAQTAIGMLWILEMLILAVGTLQALRIYRWEHKARCVQHGHSWACSRICKAKGQKTIKANKVCSQI
jgi:hypothetical protein